MAVLVRNVSHDSIQEEIGRVQSLYFVAGAGTISVTSQKLTRYNCTEIVLVVVLVGVEIVEEEVDSEGARIRLRLPWKNLIWNLMKCRSRYEKSEDAVAKIVLQMVTVLFVGRLNQDHGIFGNLFVYETETLFLYIPLL